MDYPMNSGNYTSLGVGGIGNAMISVAPPPVSIHDECKQIEQSLNLLHQVAEQLQMKLEPVLSPEAPTPESGMNQKEAMGMSAIVLQLRSHRRSIEAAHARLLRVFQRVEL